MSGSLCQQSELLDRIGFPFPTAKIGFKLTLGMLDRPIVGCRIDRVVDRDDQGLVQHIVYGRVIEVSAIVPFAEQRSAEPRKEMTQMARHLLTAGRLR